MPFLLLDLETTGLDTQTDHILEVAAHFLSDNLYIEATFHAVLQLRMGARVDAEVVRMHTVNGLLAECLKSDTTIEQTDDALVKFVDRHRSSGPEMPLLCGNSIHFDRAFMNKWMPHTLGRLHYRQLDLSSLNEFNKRFRPELYEARPKPAKGHRALADIAESLELLQYYAAHP